MLSNERHEGQTEYREQEQMEKGHRMELGYKGLPSNLLPNAPVSLISIPSHKLHEPYRLSVAKFSLNP
jgi:hypothetical protein